MESLNIPLYDPPFLSRDWCRANPAIVKGVAGVAAFLTAVGCAAALVTYYIPSCDVVVPEDAGHRSMNADVEVRLGFTTKVFEDVAFRRNGAEPGLLQSSRGAAPVMDFDPSTGVCNIITDPEPYMAGPQAGQKTPDLAHSG